MTEGGHTKEEADIAYEELFRELHGISPDEPIAEDKKEQVLVVGHIDPDTDAICSAIAYAELKNAIDPTARYIAGRAGFINNETNFVLNRFGAAPPPLIEDVSKRSGDIKDVSRQVGDIEIRHTVILVDHNEKSQAVIGIEEANILEIIDHHRLGGMETTEPIYFRNQPVGSTSTIISRIYKENGEIPSKMIAGLLCSGIISDTLMFRSPATTREDKLAAVELAGIANIDLEAHAAAMFEAGGTVAEDSFPERGD